ncbi:hypothetical protein WL29_20520 [Burkholderia ubonensis]|uniref:Uncharacterized protein n=2 Tax=Burkholderia ubonensis TaxID=101571 RepID=A0A106QCK9_9BURK|nr:hypothetical protein WL29_20520 [Burkholderia ubonensis]
MADDGISGLVWLHMAKRYLSQGRTVLAITDDRNEYEAIGTGDGLPSYGPELKGNPNFRTTTVSQKDAGMLLRELQNLDTETVVMFNMSPFEFLRHNAEWQDVVAFCAESENEMVVSHYYMHSIWQYDLERLMQMDGSELMALADIGWDYVAGWRLVSDQNIEPMRRLFPSLAGQISPLRCYGAPRSDGAAVWQIITHAGSFELHPAYALIRNNLDSHPAMWDVNHNLESVAVSSSRSPQKEVSLGHKIVLALKAIF